MLKKKKFYIFLISLFGIFFFIYWMYKICVGVILVGILLGIKKDGLKTYIKGVDLI